MENIKAECKFDHVADPNCSYSHDRNNIAAFKAGERTRTRDWQGKESRREHCAFSVGNGKKEHFGETSQLSHEVRKVNFADSALGGSGEGVMDKDDSVHERRAEEKLGLVAGRNAKPNDLMEFAANFKLLSRVPIHLLGITAKDHQKQMEIEMRAEKVYRERKGRDP